MVVHRRKKIENQSKFDFCLGGYIRARVRVRAETSAGPTSYLIAFSAPGLVAATGLLS